MLTVYVAADGRIHKRQIAGGEEVPAAAVWLDLFQPTPDEERAVERALGIEVPTPEEMREIEASSRLYREDDAVHMTATIVTKATTEHPESSAITFILAANRLVTLRYADPQPFRSFAASAERQPATCGSGQEAFLGLLEAIVDRLADLLELAGTDIDALSREVFATNAGASKGRDFQDVLARVGRNGALNSKARESLVSIGRLLTFAGQAAGAPIPKAVQARLESLSRDVQSLGDHASFLANKVTFVLDATLGMINIEQNAIIKIVSVAAVVFLPPTLVASVYGMNFAFMPELAWPLGYPFALLLMIASAVLPYLYFKRRGWL